MTKKKQVQSLKIFQIMKIGFSIVNIITDNKECKKKNKALIKICNWNIKILKQKNNLIINEISIRIAFNQMLFIMSQPIIGSKKFIKGGIINNEKHGIEFGEEIIHKKQ